MPITPGPRYSIGGGSDHTNDRPTSSGGVSGPFRARRGFDAHNHKGVNFQDPDLPGNLANPSGDGEVVNSSFFWDHANFIRWDGRAGFLPNPLKTEIVTGEQYAIRTDFNGKFIGRIAVWDEQLAGPAKAEILAGSVFGVIRQQEITDPLTVLADLTAFVVGVEGGQIAAAAGTYVLNSSGAASGPVPVNGGAANLSVNDGEALMWMGDNRLGTSGWMVVSGPAFKGVHTGATAVGKTPGNWRYLNTLTWLKALVADPDQAIETKDGDTQYTIENQAKELKVWENGAWHKIYGEVDVKAWIAALSLFEGTVQEIGGGVPNVMEMSALPDLTLNTQIDKIAHYFTWQGSPGYVIQATDPQGVGRDLPGTILNPGDWLQVSNRSGDANAPDLRWTHVGGDLLAKSRGDNLYGLKPWAAGGWEIGSLVVHDGSIWRATGPITAADIAPGAKPGAGQVASAWQKITLGSGVRWVSTDTDLPANAPPGEIYFVLQSAQANGAGALMYWDAGASTWVLLGGSGGQPMDLSAGIPIVNVGVPIGTVLMWLNVTPPPGWLVLDGSNFSAGTYPELAQVLGNTRLIDMRGMFPRGAGLNQNGTWGEAGRLPGSWQDYATARPHTAFTTDNQGDHQHGMRTNRGNTDWRGGGTADHALVRQGGGDTTDTAGHHQHTITGGDEETRPRNMAFVFIIKAADVAQRVRI